MNNLKKNKIINFFTSSIIFFLISGSFFPDLIVSLFSLVFLIYVFKNKLFFYFKKKPLIIFFIFCIYCILVSIFVAKDTMLSLESSLFYFRIGVFSCVLWYLIEKNKKILNYFFYTLTISFLILFIDGFFQFYTGMNMMGFSKIEGGVSSFFDQEKIMGSYLSRLFPLLFALFLLKKKNFFELYFMSLFFIFIGSLILISGERASFFFIFYHLCL
jgi:hypothetical protein